MRRIAMRTTVAGWNGGQAWLRRRHDHKFDQFTSSDFYR